MKNKKRFIAIIMTLCMCIGMSLNAFATEVSEYSVKANEDAALPTDAIILHQNEDIIIYQSETKSNEESEVMPLTDDNYGYKWIDRDDSDTFKVNCTLTGAVNGTFKVESSNNSDVAQMTISGPMTSLPITLRVHPYDGDVYFSLSGCSKGTYTVSYIANTTVGMRMLCWLYK